MAKTDKRTHSGVFTPNVIRGIPEQRYRLFSRGDYGRSTDRAFSATPDGPVFRAKVFADTCGMDCMCAAFIIPISKHGAEILAKAERF